MTLTSLIGTHGYWVVAAVVALESMGLPMPGETALITAAIYAGTTQHLDIVLVIAALYTGVNEGAQNWQAMWTCAIYLLFAVTLWRARAAQIPE